MSLDVSIAILTVLFAIVSAICVVCLIRFDRATKSIQADLNHLSHEVTKLVQNTNELVSDLKHKSHSLDFLFKALPHSGKKQSGSQNGPRLTGEILNWAMAGIHLFNHIKGYVKHEK